MLILAIYVYWKISLKSSETQFMSLKILLISSLHQIWIKMFFLLIFDSALKAGMSAGSEMVNLLMLVARACTDITDFFIISEAKSDGLGIHTKWWEPDLHSLVYLYLYLHFLSAELTFPLTKNVKIPTPLYRCKPTPIVHSIMLSNF